jgi:hypothetical protein
MSRATPDRRLMPRLQRQEDHGIVSAHVRPGHRARLIDVSASGALIETSHRLLPGTLVELHVETGKDRTRVRGRVLRCSVVRVRPTSVCYRGAIAFDRYLHWFVDEAGCALPTAEARPAHPGRALSTPQVI